MASQRWTMAAVRGGVHRRGTAGAAGAAASSKGEGEGASDAAESRRDSDGGAAGQGPAAAAVRPATPKAAATMPWDEYFKLRRMLLWGYARRRRARWAGAGGRCC